MSDISRSQCCPVWISAWRPSGQNPPYGINCVVEIPVRGIGTKSDRIANVRTVWVIADTDTPPRPVTAYVKV
jgi:hypothetical protein